MLCNSNKLKLWLYIWLTTSIAIKCDKFLEEQRVKLRLERAKCKCAPALCTIECSVKFVSRQIANFNALWKLFEALNYIEYDVRTYYKHSNNEYRPMLILLKGEFCKNYLSPLAPLHMLLAIVGNTTNLRRPCPFMPGDYYAKDFNFSIKDWPSSFIPEGRHMINLTAYSRPNVFLLNVEAYYSVTNHGILDLRVG